MGKVYQSAQGKMVDMTALAAKNERVRAVGNMGVNSRGDVIDSNNTVINTSSARISALQERSTSNLDAIARATPQAPALQSDDVETAKIEFDLEEEFSEPNPPKEETKKVKKR